MRLHPRHGRGGRRGPLAGAALGSRPRPGNLVATLALPASLLLIALPAVSPSTRVSASAASVRSALAPRARAPFLKHVARYRIVGCRSRGAVAYREGPSRMSVAIGFDDGPAPDTRAFVEMLERARARATFFMIGEQISGAYGGLLRRELRDGDVLGDHTFTHPYLTSSGEVRAQLLRTLNAISALTGYRPCVFRPPYGAYDQSVIQTARSLGLATVLWNVDPSDYTQPGVGAIEQRVLAQVRPGSIIISHDGGGPRGETLAAYPAIISALRARGYRILTIPELLGFRPVYARCAGACREIGVPRSALPRGAIIEAVPVARTATGSRAASAARSRG